MENGFNCHPKHDPAPNTMALYILKQIKYCT